MSELPSSTRRLVSKVRSDAVLELSIETTDIPSCADDEVLVRVEAAPLNPSDQAVMFAFADLSTARQSGNDSAPVIEADIPKRAMPMLKTRIGKSMPIGNEGAGTVIATGAKTQGLLGKTVATMAGGMYSEFRMAKAKDCLPVAPGVSADQAASSVVNPMTALCMTEVMRREGHTALIHTAAASNLGQMLNRICLADGIAIVNIVRKQEQANILKELGAEHICNSSEPSFMQDLSEAIAATGATLCFDATGGGDLASQVLTAMEIAQNRDNKNYSVYGSTTLKQVYQYGFLDRAPTVLQHSYGMAWSVSGFLLPNYLAKLGPETTLQLFGRVLSELTSTFASQYSAEVSLAGALQLDAIKSYSQQATGKKYLVMP
ncbi:MAG: zinc-binding dehydrogenase [Oceanococcus sp.]